MQPRHRAEHAIVELKTAVLEVLNSIHPKGISNVDLGRELGINHGYNGGNEGHIQRTILGLLTMEGLAYQNLKTKLWYASNQG